MLAVMKMLPRRNAPSTLIDDPLFQIMMSKSFKELKGRDSRYFARNVLPRVAGEILKVLRSEIGENYFSITTDGWSAMRKPSPSFYR